jgi:hypothetical protein
LFGASEQEITLAQFAYYLETRAGTVTQSKKPVRCFEHHGAKVFCGLRWHRRRQQSSC